MSTDAWDGIIVEITEGNQTHAIIVFFGGSVDVFILFDQVLVILDTDLFGHSFLVIKPFVIDFLDSPSKVP